MIEKILVDLSSNPILGSENIEYLKTIGLPVILPSPEGEHFISYPLNRSMSAYSNYSGIDNIINHSKITELDKYCFLDRYSDSQYLLIARLINGMYTRRPDSCYLAAGISSNDIYIFVEKNSVISYTVYVNSSLERWMLCTIAFHNYIQNWLSLERKTVEIACSLILKLRSELYSIDPLAFKNTRNYWPLSISEDGIWIEEYTDDFNIPHTNMHEHNVSNLDIRNRLFEELTKRMNLRGDDTPEFFISSWGADRLYRYSQCDYSNIGLLDIDRRFLTEVGIPKSFDLDQFHSIVPLPHESDTEIGFLSPLLPILGSRVFAIAKMDVHIGLPVPDPENYYGVVENTGHICIVNKDRGHSLINTSYSRFMKSLLAYRICHDFLTNDNGRRHNDDVGHDAYRWLWLELIRIDPDVFSNTWYVWRGSLIEKFSM